MVPVGSDKVPCQRLTDGVTSNRNNGGGGVLLTDLRWVQTVLQIPATHSQWGQKPNSPRLLLAVFDAGHQNTAVTILSQPMWVKIVKFRKIIMQRYASATDLLSSQGCLVHDRAYMSLSASEAMVAFSYMDQAKSHSSTPPAAIALQYTVVFKLGLILERLIQVIKC